MRSAATTGDAPESGENVRFSPLYFQKSQIKRRKRKPHKPPGSAGGRSEATEGTPQRRGGKRAKRAGGTGERRRAGRCGAESGREGGAKRRKSTGRRPATPKRATQRRGTRRTRPTGKRAKRGNKQEKAFDHAHAPAVDPKGQRRGAKRGHKGREVGATAKHKAPSRRKPGGADRHDRNQADRTPRRTAEARHLFPRRSGGEGQRGARGGGRGLRGAGGVSVRVRSASGCGREESEAPQRRHEKRKRQTHAAREPAPSCANRPAGQLRRTIQCGGAEGRGSAKGGRCERKARCADAMSAGRGQGSISQA